MDPTQPAGAGDSIDKVAADKAIDEHNMTDMKLVLMDSADLASRSANMAADAGIELRLASKNWWTPTCSNDGCNFSWFFCVAA